MRTFIALETPEPIRKKIHQLQARLAEANAEVRWESIDKLHATVKFLGDVDERNMPEVLSRIESTSKAYRTFDLRLHQLGCFPNQYQPRIIWLGCLNTNGVLDLLKISLDNELSTLGFEIEARAFHPHITLGRVKGQQHIYHLTSMMEKLTFEPQHFEVDEVVVVKSELKPGGSEYSPLLRVRLQG